MYSFQNLSLGFILIIFFSNLANFILKIVIKYNSCKKRRMYILTCIETNMKKSFGPHGRPLQAHKDSISDILWPASFTTRSRFNVKVSFPLPVHLSPNTTDSMSSMNVCAFVPNILSLCSMFRLQMVNAGNIIFSPRCSSFTVTESWSASLEKPSRHCKISIASPITSNTPHMSRRNREQDWRIKWNPWSVVYEANSLISSDEATIPLSSACFVDVLSSPIASSLKSSTAIIFLVLYDIESAFCTFDKSGKFTISFN